MKDYVKIVYLGEDISSEVEDFVIEPLISGVNCIRLEENTYMVPPNDIKLYLHNGDIITTHCNDCDITVFYEED